MSTQPNHDSVYHNRWRDALGRRVVLEGLRLPQGMFEQVLGSERVQSYYDKLVLLRTLSGIRL